MNCKGLSMESDLSFKQLLTLGKIFWSFNQNQGHEFFIWIPFLLFPLFKQLWVEFPNPSAAPNAHPCNNSLFKHLSAQQEPLHPRSCPPDCPSLAPCCLPLQLWTLGLNIAVFLLHTQAVLWVRVFPLRIFSCLIKLHTPYSFSMNGNNNVVSLCFLFLQEYCGELFPSIKWA